MIIVTTPEPKARVQSVSRAVAILLHVARSPDGLSAREVSDAVGLQLGTVQHLLQSLAVEGFLAKDQRRRYRLGMKISVLTEAFPRHLDPPEHLTPYIRALAQKTGEAAYISGWRSGRIVIYSYVPGEHPVTVGDLGLGPVDDAHARASGKLLLALSTPESRENYLDGHPPQPRTPATIVDPASLELEFRSIRERGYAVDREEYAPGVCCLAAAVSTSAPLFTFSISAPTERFELQFERYLTTLLETAKAAASSVHI
jgi:DNA-binding IclR family transcriptional regulator